MGRVPEFAVRHCHRQPKHQVGGRKPFRLQAAHLREAVAYLGLGRNSSGGNRGIPKLGGLSKTTTGTTTKKEAECDRRLYRNHLAPSLYRKCCRSGILCSIALH
jgi:hypothetical protein